MLSALRFCLQADNVLKNALGVDHMIAETATVRRRLAEGLPPSTAGDVPGWEETRLVNDVKW